MPADLNDLHRALGGRWELSSTGVTLIGAAVLVLCTFLLCEAIDDAAAEVKACITKTEVG